MPLTFATRRRRFLRPRTFLIVGLVLVVLFWIHLMWKGTQVHDAVAKALLQ